MKTHHTFPLTLALVMASTASIATPRDQYYSTDIFTAIEEARERTHHYDYSRATRYNRSTSQSIQFPRLLNKEMAQTVIETPDEQVTGGDPDIDDGSNLDSASTITKAPQSAQSVSIGNTSPATVRVTIR